MEHAALKLIYCFWFRCAFFNVLHPQVVRHMLIASGLAFFAVFVVVVVALLFYVHGKHLRSCRDGQLT